MDRGAWRATVHGVTKSWTERLSTYRIRSEVNITQSCPTLRPHALYHPWNSPGQNIEVGGLSRLPGIFQPRDWTQVDSLPAEPQGSRLLERVAYPFSNRLSTYSVMANWQTLKKITTLNASEDGVSVIENVNTGILFHWEFIDWECKLVSLFWKAIWQYDSRIFYMLISIISTYFQQSILGNNPKYWQKCNHQDVLCKIIYSCKRSKAMLMSKNRGMSQ